MVGHTAEWEVKVRSIDGQLHGVVIGGCALFEATDLTLVCIMINDVHRHSQRRVGVRLQLSPACRSVQ
eukprot:44678-Eustigmatos_ZCMA.PRE.1